MYMELKRYCYQRSYVPAKNLSTPPPGLSAARDPQPATGDSEKIRQQENLSAALQLLIRWAIVPTKGGGAQMGRFATLLITGLAWSAVATAPALGADAGAMQHHHATAEQRAKCFDEWEIRLASSDDPIDYVADAVMAACREPMVEADKAAKEALTHLSWSDITATHATMKKAIVTRLVVRRVASKASADTASIAPSAPSEPKTREGKLARCDRDDAEWREWVAERGHVRIAIMEEHEQEKAACTAAAEKLPLAADYHAVGQQ